MSTLAFQEGFSVGRKWGRKDAADEIAWLRGQQNDWARDAYVMHVIEVLVFFSEGSKEEKYDRISKLLEKYGYEAPGRLTEEERALYLETANG